MASRQHDVTVWNIGRHRMTTWLAWGLFSVAVGLAALATVLAALRDGPVDGFALAANVTVAASLAAAGAPLAAQRSRNPIGWLFLFGAVSHGLVAVTEFWPASWVAAVAVALALLTFPFGRLRNRLWRPTVLILAPLLVATYLTMPFWNHSDGGWVAGIVVWVMLHLGILGSLLSRYRDGDEVLRRQLLWLPLALAAGMVVSLPGLLLQAGRPSLVPAIPFLPAAMTVATLRYRLIDVRRVLSRTMLYLVVVFGALGVFAGLRAVLNRLSEATMGASALAMVVVALLFGPVRSAMQPVFDRALHATRQDAVQAFSRLDVGLDSDRTSLDTLLSAVRDALQLPFAAFRLAGRDVAVSGSAAGPLEAITLATSGSARGEFVISTRPGQRRLGARDLQVLTVLAIPLGVALRATLLAEELQVSRGRIVAAREEERRRLRRDLHDGLGPMLSGLAYAVDAARNRVEKSATGDTRDLLDRLRSEIAKAIVEIRRVVEGLRPPALDELGLTEALRGAAERLSFRAGGHPIDVTIDTPIPLPELPAAVEVAAYRIVTEALNNVVKHSDATSVRVQLTAIDELHIQVVDDGKSAADGWTPGVGLSSMSERAAEVGGRCLATPTTRGGRVEAVLPLTPT